MSNWRILVFLFLLSPITLMQDALADSKPVLRIAIPENYSPFYYRDADGNFKGASYEIVSEICNRLGYNVVVTQFPNMRIVLAELANGNQDINLNLTATDERRKVALFTSTPHIYESQNLIVRADTQIHYTGRLIELARFRFGPVFGWTYGPQFDNADFLHKDYVNDTVAQLRGLLAGQFDFAVNNRQFFLDLAAQMGVSHAFKAITPPLYQLPVTIAVSKKYPRAAELVQALDTEVIKIQKEPIYRDILTRYGFDLPNTNLAVINE